MKTKINTLLALCALAFIGIININATADNKKIVNSEVVTEKAEMVTIETGISEKNLFYSAEAFSAIDFADEINKFAAKQTLPEKNAIEKSDSLTFVDSITASTADLEIEKYARKLQLLHKTRTGK